MSWLLVYGSREALYGGSQYLTGAVFMWQINLMGAWIITVDMSGMNNGGKHLYRSFLMNMMKSNNPVLVGLMLRHDILLYNDEIPIKRLRVMTIISQQHTYLYTYRIRTYIHVYIYIYIIYVNKNNIVTNLHLLMFWLLRLCFHYILWILSLIWEI